VLYSLTTSISLAQGLSPTHGFIHGQTRRGGWTFDLADIFKVSLHYDLCFDKKPYKTTELMYEFNKRIKEKNQFIIKNMIKINSAISNKSMSELEQIYENCRP